MLMILAHTKLFNVLQKSYFGGKICRLYNKLSDLDSPNSQRKKLIEQDWTPKNSDT